MPLTIASGGLYVKFGRKFVPTTATVEEFDAMQSELRRLRISQLRKMEQIAFFRSSWWSSQSVMGPIEHKKRCEKNASKLWNLGNACLVEIARLRGEG